MIVSLDWYENIRNWVDLYIGMEGKSRVRGRYIEKDL
jgi:hypothetical protein